MRNWLVSILVLVMGVSVAEAAVIDVDALTERRGLGKDVEILVDTHAGFSIEQVTKSPVSKQFVVSESATPSFGYTRSAIWVKLELESREGKQVVLQLG